MTPLTSDLATLPRYDYNHSHHPETGTRDDLPPIFQIHVHYEPYYAPFPVTVRSDMKISDLITQLSYLFNTKRIFFFKAIVFETCGALFLLRLSYWCTGASV
jgi:hypothetical protein